MPRTLILIPARGGSQGVPRKNLRLLAGTPLVAWTVRHALTVSGPLVDVVVSTDDAEIAQIARAAGARVPFLRPAELALDHSPTEAAVIHALDELEATGPQPDRVMLLQPTSPLRHPDTVARALAQFDESGVDALVGVVPQAPFVWRSTQPPTAGYDVNARPRRQELGPDQLTYRETGSLYVTATDIYRRCSNRIGGNVGLFVMDETEGVDIDTEADLVVAEAQLRHAAESRSGVLA